MFSFLHVISCNYKKGIMRGINVGLYGFSIEDPSMVFLIPLLGEIFLYQPRACTSPQKGVTDHPLA